MASKSVSPATVAPEPGFVFHVFASNYGHISAMGELVDHWNAGHAHYYFLSRRELHDGVERRMPGKLEYSSRPLAPALDDWKQRFPCLGELHLTRCRGPARATLRLNRYCDLVDRLVAGHAAPRCSGRFTVASVRLLQEVARHIRGEIPPAVWLFRQQRGVNARYDF